MNNDLISRYGVAAWLTNMGYPKLAEIIEDETRFPPEKDNDDDEIN